jgi:hypothetical protein
MIKNQYIFLIILLGLNLANNTRAQEETWDTFYEKSGYKQTPNYEQTIDYCIRLDEASPWVKYTTFGTSPQGRKLPLLIVDRNGYSDPISVRNSGNLVILIQAGIHAGEIDGKDAGLMLFRDIAIHQKHFQILENLTILFIPIFSVDGHERFSPYNRINQNGPEEMGWRTTAQNLNLNRDYLKADAPEMHAWLQLYQRWLPDFFMDIHATDGADYQYASTYGLEVLGNMDQGLSDWAMETLIPGMEQQMDEEGYPVFPYVMFRRWHDPRSGLRSGVAPPRYSTGYTATQNRIGLLVENHMLKDYETRVSATYELIRVVCGILNEDASRVRDLNALADMSTASPVFREIPFPVRFTAGPDSIMVDFRGVNYEVETSDLTGGPWFRYHPDKDTTFRLPFFYQQLPERTVQLPEAYIIPPEWTEVIKRLPLHGIDYSILKKRAFVQVQSFKFRDYEWRNTPYEGRFILNTEWDTIEELREYPAGSVVVDMNQRTARVIACIFEPSSQDSYLEWGFFNTIFERKEYFETYVMEGIARKMIEENPVLEVEFKQWKEEHPEFANNQWVQLEWFYRRSPWWDPKKDVYPVGKIMDRLEVEEAVRLSD